jgi:hypothetical protein
MTKLVSKIHLNELTCVRLVLRMEIYNEIPCETSPFYRHFYEPLTNYQQYGGRYCCAIVTSPTVRKP